MDSGSTIIGLILLALCILPFVLITYSKNNKKQMLQLLQKIAIGKNSEITLHDSSGNFAIGTDEKLNYIYFFKKKKTKEISLTVDLSEIQYCKEINSGRTVKNSNVNTVITEKLQLSFIPSDKNKPSVVFEFYDAEDNTQISNELQLLKKWEKLVNEQISGIKQKP